MASGIDGGATTAPGWLQQRFSTLTARLPVIVWTTDLKLVCTSCTGAGLETLGAAADQVIGRTLEEHFAPAWPSFPVIEAHRRALAGESVAYEGEWRGRTHSLYLDPLVEGGAIVGCVGVSLDIGALRATERALRDSEAVFDQMVNVLPQVVWLSELPSGRPLYVSPSFRSVWGVSLEDLQARPSLFVEMLHPDDRERHQAAIAKAPAGGEIEYRIVRPDGEIRWIRDRAFPVKNAEGQVFRLAGLAEDITARRRWEQELLQVQKMDALGRLAGGVAHDFNNVLTVVMGCASLLQAEEIGQDDRRDLAEQIARSCEQAVSLTRQLLLFSRKRPPETRVTDLNQLIGSMTDMLGRLIGAHLTLQTQLTPALPSTLADPGHLEMAILNLVVNARDAMRTGGSVTIATDFDPANDVIIIDVSDTGPGIDPDTLPHIFEPFFTTKEPGKGTGLGLSTVHGVVTQLGGQVQVDSEPGHGTRFRLKLPVRRPAAGVASATPNGAPHGPRGRETVLVAEDDGAIRALVRKHLEQLGYRVLEACDGEEALKTLSASYQQVDLLLSDVVMPRMGGPQLMLHARRRHPALRVLFMTGYPGDEPEGSEPWKQGVRIIEKPFTMRTLAESVRAALDVPAGSPDAVEAPGSQR